MRRTDFLRAVHAQDDLVREPVRSEVHERGEDERDHEAVRAARDVADDQQQSAEEAEQQRRFDTVCHDG
jgi:hypothetical protein